MMIRRKLCWGVCCVVVLLSVNAFAGYRSELGRVTKHGHLYEVTTMDAKLLWHATLVTDSFRRARSQKYIELNHLDSLTAARWMAREEERQAESWEVIVTMYSKAEYEQFTTGSNSFWKIVLRTAAGEEVMPLAVEMIPTAPLERRLYPHLNRWARAYQVVFPKVELGNRAVLALQSVVGSSTLRWKLR